MKHARASLLAIALALPVAGLAAPGSQTQPKPKAPAVSTKTKVGTEVRYRTPCGKEYTAAQAKAAGFKCPVDGKSLSKIVVPKGAPKSKAKGCTHAAAGKGHAVTAKVAKPGAPARK